MSQWLLYRDGAAPASYLSQEEAHQDLQISLKSGQSAFLLALPFKPPKAVFFDMDATLIAEESLDLLAKHLGLGQSISSITEAAMAGHIDFKAALGSRAALLKGLALSEIERLWGAITLNQGAEELLETLKAHKIPYYIVSGGFDILAKRLQKKHGFSAIYVNRLGQNQAMLDGTLKEPIVDAQAKREFLLSVCSQLKISPKETLAFGDGANDLLMLEAAGLALGINPKAKILPVLAGASFQDAFAFFSPFYNNRLQKRCTHV